MNLEGLVSDPIFEALFQIRFKSEQEATANILAGMMYPHVQGEYPRSETISMPPVPKELLDSEPQFRYWAEIRFLGENKVLAIGRNVLTVSSLMPYCKWPAFKPMILNALGHLQASGLATEIERISLKYTNVIQDQGSSKQQFENVDCQMSLGGHDLTDAPTRVRTEIKLGQFINIVNIAPHTDIKNSIFGTTAQGLLVDIDTILNVEGEFWQNHEESIEECHNAEKAIFESIIKEATLERYREATQ